MNDISPILRVLEGLSTPAVLVSVVSARGSTYRGIGARMLFWLSDSGELESVGTISGGCLEFDVMEHAREVIASGKTRIVEYDTEENDEEKLWGLGLGCNGVLQAVLELVSNDSPIIVALRSAFDQRRYMMICTLIKSSSQAYHTGERWIFQGSSQSLTPIMDGVVLLDDLGDRLTNELQTYLREMTAKTTDSTTQSFELSGEHWTFCFELQPPPLQLYIVGAGFDAIPVAHIASMLGWLVTVADYRPVYAHKQRFPSADTIILLPLEELIQELCPPPGAAVLLMSHNVALDSALFQRLIQQPLMYLGVLGPRERTQKILRDCRKSGVRVSKMDEQKIFSPVGLDLGTETPEEIALSIIAEIQAVLKGRSGGFLRDCKKNIHQHSHLRKVGNMLK